MRNALVRVAWPRGIRTHALPCVQVPHATVAFWAALLALNTLLALPAVLLAGAQGGLLPWPQDVSTWYGLLVHREHPDVMRLHLELWLLAALRLRWPRPWRRLWPWLALLWLVDGLYQVYGAAMVYLYHNPPNFYNDVAFLRSGVRFLLDALPVSRAAYAGLAVGVGLVVAVVVGLTRLVWYQVPATAVGRGSRGVLGLALLLGLGQAVVYGPTALASPQAVWVSFTAQVVANGRASRASRAEVAALLRVDPYQAYDYTAYPLARHPDIYFIFVESYGSVLYRRADWRAQYQALLTRWQTRLEADGWHMASTLSVSPVWGGGSWMAYISALFGLRVAEQQQYLALQHKFQMIPYPSLGRYLHDQGYLYTWVTPIARRLSPALLEKYRRFYGMDRWITFDDLDYHGPLYGWGPSPPDQYVLGYMRAFAREQRQPVFMVYLTQNSHYPWAPLPPVVDDWRDLAHMEDPRGGRADLEAWKQLPHEQVRADYWRAVAYTWDRLGEFLTDLADEDAVVVLLGDHQPPRVSARRDTYATPLHILSRDPAFVQRFADYGFQPGLWLDEPQATVRHEGLYSLLVRELVRHYAAPGTPLPPYRPTGLAGDGYNTPAGP